MVAMSALTQQILQITRDPPNEYACEFMTTSVFVVNFPPGISLNTNGYNYSLRVQFSNGTQFLASDIQISWNGMKISNLQVDNENSLLNTVVQVQNQVNYLTLWNNKSIVNPMNLNSANISFVFINLQSSSVIYQGDFPINLLSRPGRKPRLMKVGAEHSLQSQLHHTYPLCDFRSEATVPRSQTSLASWSP